MKHFILILSLLLFYGCSGKGDTATRLNNALDSIASAPSVAEDEIAEICANCKLTESQKSDAVRGMALARLRQGKTFLFENDLESAIRYYKSAADTTSLLEMYQLASIKMRWKNNRDSAAFYLTEALTYTTGNTSPTRSDLLVELSNLYAQPLLPKDYMKAIHYARKTLPADSTGKNRARALHDIGLFYAFLNENDSAVIYFEMALAETTPENPDYTTFVLNYANHHKSDADKSIEYLNTIKGEHLGKLITLGFIALNNNSVASAERYLNQSVEMYRKNPDRYSINTYNALRMLKGCVDYALSGEVFPEEGTVYNDSIYQRFLLNQKIESEKTEYNSRLKIRLLESESERQKIWLLCMSALVLAIVVSAIIFWRNKRRYISLKKELESIRLNQIVCETNSPDDVSSFGFVRQRAELCMVHFRKSRCIGEIQKGEIAYNADRSFLPVRERAAIQKTLLECFADFIVDLRIDAGKLSMDDIVTCLFSLMNMSNAAVAACTGCSDGAIRTRKTRLRNRLSDEMASLIFG